MDVQDQNTSATKAELKKDIGFFAAMALVVGMVIGSGIFFKPGIVLFNTGSATLGLTAWIIGGIITLTAGLTIAELAAAIPKTGGLYIYLEETYGKLWGYLFGWVQTIIYGPGTIAALGIIFITQATLFVPMGETTQKLAAIGIVAFITFINALGTKYGGNLQSVFTAAKLVPIALITVMGLLYSSNGQIVAEPAITGGAGLGAAILATLWAYDGWIAVGYVAGEMKDPGRTLPRAIVGGLGLVMLVYVSINVALLHVLPAGVLAASKTPAADVSKVLFGTGGASLIAIGILISIFGTLNGYILTGARIPFTMGERGLLPFSNFLGQLHPRFNTPIPAMIVQAILASLFILSGSFNRLTDLAVFVIYFFFTMGFVAVFILRKREPNLLRPYRVPGYPVVPIIAILGGVYILVNNLITNPMDSMLGIGLTLLGIPVYWYMTKKNEENTSS
jgi:basic amino acid/polyamine antiporter, APA family